MLYNFHYHRLSALLLGCGLTTASFATNYYTAPGASGNGLSLTTPCEFRKGLEKLAPGDTLFCRGGQYDYDATIALNMAGTAAKPIAIFAYDDERPIFDFRRIDYGARGITLSADCRYIHIKGLTIRYTGKNGLHNQGSYCTFELLDVYGNGDTGIQMKGAGGHNLILNCDSHDNFDYQLGGTSSADFGGNADGFADKQYTGAGNTYRGCRAWRNSDDGWDFYQRVTAGGRTVIEDCICFLNGPQEYDMRDHPRYDKDKAWFDQFKTPRRIVDDDGESATVSLEHYRNWGNGNGFKLGGGRTVHDVKLVKCLAVDNTVKGFDQNNNMGEMIIYNGTSFRNGCNYGFHNGEGGSLTLRNCVTLSSWSDDVLACGQVSDVNNSWNTPGVTCRASDFQSLDTLRLIAPRQADGSLPLSAFMHLKEGSSMVDAGVNAGLPFAGEAPDLGCYELGEADRFPATLEVIGGLLTQALKMGRSMEPVVLQWGGSAEGIVFGKLPEGISAEVDKVARTLTLSGQPTEEGTHVVEVTTEGGYGHVAPFLVELYVAPQGAPAIAYVTLANSAADARILRALRSCPDFAVDLLDADLAGQNYADYDVVVISSVPGSGAGAMKGLKGLAKPMLVLKPWVMKAGVWGWGTAANSADASVHLTKADHPLFTGIEADASGNVRLFERVSTNAVTYLSAWSSSTKYVELARPVSASGQAVFELPAGTSVSGTVLRHPLLTIGLSEYSMADVTSEACRMVTNAVYYLMGSEVPGSTGIEQMTMTQPQAIDHALRVRDLQGRIVEVGCGDVLMSGIYLMEYEEGGRRIVRKVIVE